MEVEQNYGDDVRIIGVPSLADVDEMQGFVDRTGSASLDHIPDPDGVLWERFGVTNHRTYVLIDDDGTRTTAGYGSLESEVVDLIAR